MNVKRRATVAVGAVALLVTVWVIPYTGTYLAARQATRNGNQLTAVQKNQEGIQRLLAGMNSLLGFVASSQSKSGRANSIFFAAQMQNICKATPGCKIEPLPAGLKP